MESRQGLTLAAACLNNRGQSFVQRLKGSSNGSPTPPAYNDELRTRTSADEVRSHHTSSLSLSLSLSLSIILLIVSEVEDHMGLKVIVFYFTILEWPHHVTIRVFLCDLCLLYIMHTKMLAGTERNFGVLCISAEAWKGGCVFWVIPNKSRPPPLLASHGVGPGSK